MSKQYKRGWLLGLGAVGVLVLVLVSVALAQPPPPRPAAAPLAALAQIRTGIFIPGMRELSIQLPAAQLTRIRAGKPTANLNVLRNAYFIQDNIPHLRVSAQRAIKLMPLEVTEGTPPTPREVTDSAQLPTAMRVYSEHLKLKYVGTLKSLTPPASVDHRSGQTSIKDQDDRGTCVAHASMAGMEVKYGGTLNLSEQDAYHMFMRQASSTCCNNGGLKTTDSADYLKANPVCAEANWGYVNLAGLGCPIANPNAHRPAAASTNAKYQINTFQKIWRNESLAADEGTWINNPAYLESLLHAGNDIIFGTHVAGWTWPVSGIVDVQLVGGNPLPSEGGHAMLIVGYNRPQQYFIVKNSWGTGCGQNGYVYLTYDYIRTYSKYGYYITAVKPLMLIRAPLVRGTILTPR